MIYEQAKQLLDVLTKQNEALQRIAISLEELNQANKSKAFNDFYKNISSEDLAAR